MEYKLQREGVTTFEPIVNWTAPEIYTINIAKWTVETGLEYTRSLYLQSLYSVGLRKREGFGQQQEVGFPGGSDGKESACNAGDPGSIPG